MSAKLVGISMSLKKGEAVYIPVNHMGVAEGEQINESEVGDWNGLEYFKMIERTALLVSIFSGQTIL